MGEPIWEPNKIPLQQTNLKKLYSTYRCSNSALWCGISMGNPHCVVQVDDIETANVAELGPLLENHERFPERVNAGFMQVVNRNHIKLRVYERGAGETQSLWQWGLCCSCGRDYARFTLITKCKLIYLVVACLLNGKA